jgi:hypothetical protein
MIGPARDFEDQCRCNPAAFSLRIEDDDQRNAAQAKKDRGSLRGLFNLGYF